MVKLRRAFTGIAVVFLAGAACNQIGGIEPGQPLICATLAQCVAASTPCHVAVACTQGECVYKNEPDGAPIADQTPGDCMTTVCDGGGNMKTVPADEDVPADDGKPCTMETCNSGSAQHEFHELIPCDTGNLGICASGLQQCSLDGQPIDGTCAGVAPKTERCETQELDEDCDGLVNEEGVDCACGDGYLSAGEECDDGGTVEEDQCSAACKLKVSSIEAGFKHTCAMLASGTIKCWGWNVVGALGVEDDEEAMGDQPGEMGDKLPFAMVHEASGGWAQSVVAGDYHSCAVVLYTELVNNIQYQHTGAKCWGGNSAGQLGQGDTKNRGDAPETMGPALPLINFGGGYEVLAAAAGGSHTCALLTGGKVKCWGDNYFGQLGLGDTENRGDVASEMGSGLPLVNLGNSNTATALAAGDDHTCALFMDGRVKCWGNNANGQCGLGSEKVIGDEISDMGDSLPYVDLGAGKKALAITAGAAHTCALLDAGTVKCWGYNAQGQLGQGDQQDRGDQANELAGLPAVDLGTGKTATAVSAGGYHTCALLNDRSVKCWGDNMFGALGLGLSDMANPSRGDAPGEMGDSLPPVDLGTGKFATLIAAGGYHTCARLNDGTVKCWGRNDLGQLGQGDIEDRGDGMGEMGDGLPTVTIW